MPQQTEAQILGREGERWFQKQLPPEWVLNVPTADFGIDGTIAIGDRTSITPFEFGIQVKTSRRWTRRKGHVIGPSVPSVTLRYWAARLLPTLLVLYEQGTGLGYYAWVQQLLARVQDVDGGKRTTSLKVPESQLVDGGCWQQIKDQAIAYHAQLASAFRTVDSLRAALATIHSLALPLRVLTFIPPPAHLLQQEQSLRMSIEASAHREVVLALRAFASKLPESSELRTRLEDAANAYRSMCSDFIGAFDDFLKAEGPVILWTSPEHLSDARPRQIEILAELVTGLSAIASRDVSYDGAH